MNNQAIINTVRNIPAGIIPLFMRLFFGRTDVYGTHDTRTGQSWQVKAPVTEQVVRDHLAGNRPFGVYPLCVDRASLAVVDFDLPAPELAKRFLQNLKELGIQGYIERSKSKGHHIWLFLDNVPAYKPRQCVHAILQKIGQPNVEVFPKQDRLDVGSYGNFVNCPLFGAYVPHDRTVFLDDNLTPYPDQFGFLRTIQRVPESVLDNAIQKAGSPCQQPVQINKPMDGNGLKTFGLLPCARKMLESGVSGNQRVACFRLAVQLRKTGLPFGSTLAVLVSWAAKNRPMQGRTIISMEEIVEQAKCAYKGREYRGCGCNDEAMRPFCDPACPLYEHNSMEGQH